MDPEGNTNCKGTTTLQGSRSQVQLFKRSKKTNQADFDKGCGCYLGSILDEMGLTMPAFRLYLHLVRRASLTSDEDKLWKRGKFKRTAQEGKRGIAKWCRMDRNTVSTATVELEKANLISVTRKARDIHVYTLLPPSVWCTWVSIDDDDGSRIPF
jgi:hypothetical protein